MDDAPHHIFITLSIAVDRDEFVTAAIAEGLLPPHARDDVRSLDLAGCHALDRWIENSKSGDQSTSVESLIAGLRRAESKTGDPRLSRALRALDQSLSAGRPPIDDTLAIEEVLHLCATGLAPNLNQACLKVARSVGGYENPRSVAERLRAKVRKLKNRP